MSESVFKDWTDKEVVDELLDIDRGLSSKEVDFAEDMGKLIYDKQGKLTEKQRAWVERILTRLDRG